jgi:hypothetical protein
LSQSYVVQKLRGLEAVLQFSVIQPLIYVNYLESLGRGRNSKDRTQFMTNNPLTISEHAFYNASRSGIHSFT